MHLQHVPYCCGGKFLCGFFPDSIIDEKFAMESFFKANPRHKVFSAKEPGSHRCCPPTFETFKQQIFELTLGMHIGFLLATTSAESDKNAKKFLSEIGFKTVGSYKKLAKANTVNLWTADFNSTIKPQFEGMKSIRPVATTTFLTS